MKKEELKQEAEVCMHNALFWLKLPISKENVEQGGSYILKLLEPREKRIAELEAQIGKMKNWCNCKNYQQCLIELAEQGKGMKPSECCVNCKKWEIKEK